MSSNSEDKFGEKAGAKLRSRSADETCARIEIAEADRLKLNEQALIGQLNESDQQEIEE